MTHLFSQVDERDFPWPHVLPATGLAAVLATASDVASLPRADRDALLAEIEQLAAGLPAMVSMPTETRVQLFRAT